MIHLKSLFHKSILISSSTVSFTISFVQLLHILFKFPPFVQTSTRWLFSHSPKSFFIKVLCVLFSFFHLLPKINGKYLLSEIKNWIKINSFQYDEVGWIKNIHRLILVHFEHKHTISFSLLAFSSLYRSRLVGRSPRRWTGQ